MSSCVSIIIPAFNSQKFIREAIQSAVDQTYVEKEIIVVDDGSSDDTRKIAQAFESKGVRVFTQENKGAAAARNRGFRESTGRYIQFLDADDLLSPSKLEEQIQLVDLYGDEHMYTGKWGIFYNHPNQAVFRSTDLWRDFDSPVNWLITAWTKQIWMHPSAWLTPRRLIEKAGAWNESLSLHDDGEFFCRVLLQSQGVRFCDRAESFYRKGIKNSLSSIFSQRAIESYYTICVLYEKHLLRVTDSPKTRRACAANFMSFYYDQYPGNATLREKAMDAAKRLGGSDVAPNGTALFHLVRRLAGWRMAKWVERFYYGNGLNRASMKRRLREVFR
jgi:glycosyltransferase involved in cell wall biosynthesis